jgi:hypothetical protein
MEKQCCYECAQYAECKDRCPNDYSSCQFCAWFLDCEPCKKYTPTPIGTQIERIKELDELIRENKSLIKKYPTDFALKHNLMELLSLRDELVDTLEDLKRPQDYRNENIMKDITGD